MMIAHVQQNQRSRLCTLIVLTLLDRSYGSYSVAVIDVDQPDLNIAMLPKGVAASIVDDGNLEIFVPTTQTVNSVADKRISTLMVLGNWDDKVVYVENGDLWSIKMRK